MMVDEPDFLAAERLDAFHALGDYLPTAVTSGAANGEHLEHLESWPAIDLAPYLRGEVTVTLPTMLRRDDAHALLYAGRVNGIHGDSGLGKSWLAQIAAAQLLDAGEHVTWIDFEDPDASTIIERLRALGVTDDAIDAQLHYHRPTDFFSNDAVDLIAREVLEHRVALVVIDSLGEAFGLEGINEDKDAEVRPWMRRVPRKLAETGAAVLLVDHATKAGDNALHPSGSKAKRAAITGSSYLVEAPAPLTREQGGRLRLTCAKDRHGHYRRGAVSAEIDFTVYPDGGMTVHVWPPSASSLPTAEAKLLVVARAAVRTCKEAGEPLSQRRLTERLAVKASNETKRAGIEEAVARGSLRIEEGPRGTALHIYVRDLELSQ